ncbi:MAG: hypothetical protein RLY97_839 [Pseudomonadota bacterium]|jgi:hypothetical protein
MNDTETDPAKKRFFTLQMIRFAGVIMAIIGAGIVAEKIALPVLLGYFLLINGLVDVFVIPQILVKKWKSNP